MANAFKCDVCGKYYEEHTIDLKNVSIDILGISSISGADFLLKKEDLCPECYEKIKQILNLKVENVQSESNTDCFEKEMTQKEALKLMQETWCWKCKGLSEHGMCRKSLPRSGRSCVDAVMSNEIPEAFEEDEIKILKKVGGNKNEN